MKILHKSLEGYLSYCQYQKGLNSKTLKSYRIDISQFLDYIDVSPYDISKQNIYDFITQLHQQYKPKSIKRKLASIRAFYTYLEYEEMIENNPFSKIKIKSNEPFILPRTIPMHIIETILSTAYALKDQDVRNRTEYQYKTTVRDIAILELLFATGMRVSELCSLKFENINLLDCEIKIYGKGAKERIIQIGNEDVITALKEYYKLFEEHIEENGSFFINRLNHQLSEQSVRFMIKKYTDMAGISLHITPHMFRHSFATLLLEEDVDIRYIQKLLGHSSITTTQIYTHVTSKKQRDILVTKHPRNKMNINKG